jgi:hypothetical protein
MSNVEPIRKSGDTPDVEPVFPGVEAALVQAIDDKRSLSLKTMFLQKTAPKEHERVMASLFCVTAVIALREKVIECKREQQNAQELLDGLSNNPEKIAAIKAEIVQLQADAANHSADEEKKFRAAGRTGAFALVGAAKTRATGFVTDIQKKQNELVALDADTTRQRDELQKAVKNWGVAIANAEREIAIRRESYGE